MSRATLRPGHKLSRSAAPPVQRVIVRGGDVAPLGARIGRALETLLPKGVRRFTRELRGVQTRGVWAAGEQGRTFLDWTMPGLTPDQVTRMGLVPLRNRAQELERNNPYMQGYLRLHRLKVIGPRGHVCTSTVRDMNGDLMVDVNAYLDEQWRLWSRKKVSICGRWTLVELAKQLVTTMVRDGEAFVRLWRYWRRNRWAFAIEAIDPSQIDEKFNRARSSDGTRNAVRMGIEVDQYGAPVQYWIKPNPEVSAGLRESQPVPASEIIHLYRPTLVNSARNVTHAHSFMVVLHHLYQGLEAHLVSQRTSASKMGFLQWRDGANPGEMDEDDDAVDPETGELQPLESVPMEANAGSIEELPWGREFVPWDPQPTQGLPDFVRTNLRGFAAGGGPSYASMSKDVTGASYSSLRWDMNAENEYWEDNQEYFISNLFEPLREAWLECAMLTGALRLPTMEPDDYVSHEWTPPGNDLVDPLKEIEADILAIANGLMSWDEAIARRGRTRKKVWSEIAEAKKEAEALGIKVDGGLSPTTTDVNAPEAAAAGGISSGKE